MGIRLSEGVQRGATGQAYGRLRSSFECGRRDAQTMLRARRAVMRSVRIVECGMSVPRVTRSRPSASPSSMQHRLCHEFARRFRTYTDGRPDRAATPPPEPRPHPVAFPHSSAQPLSAQARFGGHSSRRRRDAARASYKWPLLMPCGTPQWKWASTAERQAMTVAELQAWQQR
jgi:hypothetical protein